MDLSSACCDPVFDPSDIVIPAVSHLGWQERRATGDESIEVVASSFLKQMDLIDVEVEEAFKLCKVLNDQMDEAHKMKFRPTAGMTPRA